MGQVNINPTTRSSGSGTAIAVLLGIIVVILLVWLLGFNGLNTLTGTPASGATSITKPATSSSTINVAPSVNVQAPAGGSTNPAPASSAPASAAGGAAAPAAAPAAPAAKP